MPRKVFVKPQCPEPSIRQEANGRDGSAHLSMGLDLCVIEGDERLFADRISSYSGFDDFRKEWARLLGFDLEDMDGFGGEKPWTIEPLQCFFDHSDCEGEISWQDAQQILAQARKDAPKLPDFDKEFNVLIRACEAAVANKLPISFR